MKTLGQFYREKITGRDDLATRTVPIAPSEVRIERDLFGWKLIVDSATIPCRSETEARFLLVYADAGMTDIGVPHDDEYLASILPELERMKARMDEIINSYAETIRDRRLRERLRHEVFADLLE